MKKLLLVNGTMNVDISSGFLSRHNSNFFELYLTEDSETKTCMQNGDTYEDAEYIITMNSYRLYDQNGESWPDPAKAVDRLVFVTKSEEEAREVYIHLLDVIMDTKKIIEERTYNDVHYVHIEKDTLDIIYNKYITESKSRLTVYCSDITCKYPDGPDNNEYEFACKELYAVSEKTF